MKLLSAVIALAVAANVDLVHADSRLRAPPPDAATQASKPATSVPAGHWPRFYTETPKWTSQPQSDRACSLVSSALQPANGHGASGLVGATECACQTQVDCPAGLSPQQIPGGYICKKERAADCQFRDYWVAKGSDNAFAAVPNPALGGSVVVDSASGVFPYICEGSISCDADVLLNKYECSGTPKDCAAQKKVLESLSTFDRSARLAKIAFEDDIRKVTLLDGICQPIKPVCNPGEIVRQAQEKIGAKSVSVLYCDTEAPVNCPKTPIPDVKYQITLLNGATSATCYYPEPCVPAPKCSLRSSGALSGTPNGDKCDNCQMTVGKKAEFNPDPMYPGTWRVNTGSEPKDINFQLNSATFTTYTDMLKSYEAECKTTLGTKADRMVWNDEKEMLYMPGHPDGCCPTPPDLCKHRLGEVQALCKAVYNGNSDAFVVEMEMPVESDLTKCCHPVPLMTCGPVFTPFLSTAAGPRPVSYDQAAFNKMARKVATKFGLADVFNHEEAMNGILTSKTFASDSGLDPTLNVKIGAAECVGKCLGIFLKTTQCTYMADTAKAEGLSPLKPDFWGCSELFFGSQHGEIVSETDPSLCDGNVCLKYFKQADPNKLPFWKNADDFCVNYLFDRSDMAGIPEQVAAAGKWLVDPEHLADQEMLDSITKVQNLHATRNQHNSGSEGHYLRDDCQTSCKSVLRRVRKGFSVDAESEYHFGQCLGTCKIDVFGGGAGVTESYFAELNRQDE